MKRANEWTTTQLLVQLSKILLSHTSTYYGTVHSDAPTCAYTYPLSSYHLLEINIDEWPRSQQEPQDDKGKPSSTKKASFYHVNENLLDN
jgi:hypothetical protein